MWRAEEGGTIPGGGSWGGAVHWKELVPNPTPAWFYRGKIGGGERATSPEAHRPDCCSDIHC